MQACEIGDASRGTLSSYAYIILLIHYLQRCTPPVLPCLQQMPPPGHDKAEPRVVDGWDTYFFDDLTSLVGYFGINLGL